MVFESMDLFPQGKQTKINGTFIGDGDESRCGVGRVEILFGGAAC